MAARRGKCKAEELKWSAGKRSKLVMAGLVPATPIKEARPCHIIGVAGSSPAMTLM
jgi:hypothetical protein